MSAAAHLNLLDDAQEIANQLPSLVDIFGSLHCRPDIPNAIYHADRSCVSTSGMKEILRSPAHYQAYLNGATRTETQSMFMGTAVHSKLLEPHLFAQEYVVSPYSDKRGADYKKFALENANRRILTPSQMDILDGISRSVANHVSANTLLKGGLVEHSIIWQDEETGIWLKIRPDCLCIDFDTGICLDVKKTINASGQKFRYSCEEYMYDLQAAVYLEGLRIVFQRDFDFVFLAVEESAPYACALYGAPEDMLNDGKKMFRKALKLLQQCRAANHWPAYQPDGDYEVLGWRPRRVW